MLDSIPNWLLLGFGLAIVVGAWLLQWYVSPKEKRQQMRQAVLDAAIERLVDAAEQMFRDRPKSGRQKFEWVMGELSRRFPGQDWNELGKWVEAAVYRQNERKAAVQASVQASQPPRQNGTHQ